METSNNLLSKEKRLATFALAILVCSSVSGFIPYASPLHNNFVLWSVLVHIISSISLGVILSVYLFIHVKRIIGFRRPIVFITGLIALFVFLSMSITGGYLLLYGQQENQKWVLTTHIVSASLFIFLCVVHVLFHVFLLPEKRKNLASDKMLTLGMSSIKFTFVANALVITFVWTVNFAYNYTLSPYKSTPSVEPYSYSYGDHPFRPSQTETYHNNFIDERQISNSQRCFSCHNDIGNQWLSSVHRQAASDPTYVTNVSLLANKKGIEATRYCEGCHAPVALLSGQLTPGGKHGGIENTISNHEGISCMSCHGISDLTHLKGVASFTFTPADDYLFARSDSHLLASIHDLLIKLKPEQHKKDMGRPILKDSKFCSACHSQFMDKDMNDWGWVKMQDEYGAWLNSPFSQQQNHSFSNAEVMRCQDCHMKLKTSNDPSSNDNGMIRSHNFAAANTMLPFLSGDEEQLQAVTKFLRSNKMRVSIEEPNRKDAIQNQQALNETLRLFDEAPHYFYLGEKAVINVAVSNIGVGHNFPGGTIDINQAWLEFSVMDSEDNVVFQSGHVDENNYVDKEAHFYHSIAIDRFGNHVWKHDLFNMVGESFRRVIKPGASDIVEYSFTIPSWAKSPLTITWKKGRPTQSEFLP